MVNKKTAGLLLAGWAAFMLQRQKYRKRERLLRSAYKKRLRQMQERNKEESDRLYASAAHTIRMPLSIAMGYTGLIQRGVVTKPEEKEQYIQRICDQIVYLNDSMKSILDAKQRPFENSRKRKEEQTELGALFTSMLPDFKYTAALRKDRFFYEPPAYPVWVRAGEDVLKNVFYNLMENSLKYMGRRGTISVRVEGVKGGRVMIIWKDDGKGIDEKEVPFIFLKGWRGKQNGSGNGMGLFLIHRTVTSMGGTIRAVSGPDQGMTFYILLPEADRTHRNL